MNNYLIISNDGFNINLIIDEIKNQIPKDIDIIKYNAVDNSIMDIIEELDTFCFLFPKKLVIFNDFELVDEITLKFLIKYLENPSENYLILVAKSLNKSTLSKISKYVNLFEKEISTEDLIKKNLHEYKMDKETILFFIDYCLNNNEKILNELIKIKLAKDDDEYEITKQDIIDNVVRDYEDDPFALPNAIAKKNKEKALEIFNRLSKKEKDSNKLLATISHQVRLLFVVKVLSKTKSIQEICELTGNKEYPVKLAINNAEYFREEELTNLLLKLSDIEINSRKDSTNINLLFEILILGL